MDAAVQSLPSGEAAGLFSAQCKPLAISLFNPHSLIAAGVVTRKMIRPSTWLRRALPRARLAPARAAIRLYYYRLRHAEAEGLPALVIDWCADVLIC